MNSAERAAKARRRSRAVVGGDRVENDVETCKNGCFSATAAAAAAINHEGSCGYFSHWRQRRRKTKEKKSSPRFSHRSGGSQMPVAASGSRVVSCKFEVAQWGNSLTIFNAGTLQRVIRCIWCAFQKAKWQKGTPRLHSISAFAAS